MKKILSLSKLAILCLLVSSFLIHSQTAFSQTAAATTATKVPEVPPAFVGTFNLDISPDVEALLAKYITASQYQQITQPGYRVQVSQSTKRDQIRLQEAQIKERFPQIATYEIYQAPNFKLRVGNFDNRIEAYSLYRQLKPQFSSSFIVEDVILME